MSHVGADPGGVDEGRHPVQPRNYLRPCLLLLLGEEPTYGYELRDKLAPLSPVRWDPGTVYRTLNTMEDDGLVHSTWERSAEGPRRRLYEITPAGGAVLETWARELCGVRNMIIQFIERYEADHTDHAPLPGVPRCATRPVGLNDTDSRPSGQPMNGQHPAPAVGIPGR